MEVAGPGERTTLASSATARPTSGSSPCLSRAFRCSPPLPAEASTASPSGRTDRSGPGERTTRASSGTGPPMTRRPPSCWACPSTSSRSARASPTAWRSPRTALSSPGGTTSKASSGWAPRARRCPFRAPSAARTSSGAPWLPRSRPRGGTFQSDVDVTVFCADPAATIHYTTDGSEPSQASPIIASGAVLTISQTTTLKAGAWNPGRAPSSITTATYTSPWPRRRSTRRPARTPAAST